MDRISPIQLCETHSKICEAAPHEKLLWKNQLGHEICTYRDGPKNLFADIALAYAYCCSLIPNSTCQSIEPHNVHGIQKITDGQLAYVCKQLVSSFPNHETSNWFFILVHCVKTNYLSTLCQNSAILYKNEAHERLHSVLKKFMANSSMSNGTDVYVVHSAKLMVTPWRISICSVKNRAFIFEMLKTDHSSDDVTEIVKSILSNQIKTALSKKLCESKTCKISEKYIQMAVYCAILTEMFSNYTEPLLNSSITLICEEPHLFCISQEQSPLKRGIGYCQNGNLYYSDTVSNAMVAWLHALMEYEEVESSLKYEFADYVVNGDVSARMSNLI